MQVRNIAGKWARNAAAASGDYTAGAANPRRPWAASTAASESVYESGVQEAISRKAFGKGVQSASDAAWKRGIDEKGRTRFQQGVSTSQSDYDSGFSPFRQVLESTTLDPRGPKGTNYGRVQAVGDALRAAKLRQ